MTKNHMYVAICKETGRIMSGAKGQHAFGDPSTLAKSIGQAYSYTAQKSGIKPKDMYYIVRLHVNVEVVNSDVHQLNVGFEGV